MDFSVPEVSYNELPVRGAMDLEGISKERLDYMRKMGINPDLYTDMIAKEEAKRGELSKRKKEAKGEALMQLGLGLMGARQGQEFQTFSEAGIRSLAGLREANKELRASEEKLDDRINAFRVADQQAKQTGAEKDLAKRDAELTRVESAQREVNRDKNALSLERVKLGQESKKTQAIYEANMYGTDLQKYLGEKQIALKEKEIANTGAYYQKVLAQNEARIKAMDAASQAKYAQMKTNATKLLQSDQGYMDLQARLRKEYKDAWQSNPDAQKLLRNYETAFIGNMLDTQGVLMGGVPSYDALMQRPD
jgi:hypothetical protein